VILLLSGVQTKPDQIDINIQMPKWIVGFFSFFFASDENNSLENRLFLSTIVIGICVSFLGFIVSLIIRSSITTVITSISLSGVLLIFYYFVAVRRIFEPFIFPVIGVSFSGISVIWIFDGGINGSDGTIALIILILALIIVPDKKRKFVITLFISCISIIYLIQLYRPNLITQFPSERARWNDSFITILYSSVFIFLIIQFLLRNYTLEKRRAEVNELKYRELSESLKQSELKLLKLNADKDLFISILAHDLKNPFFNIQGLSELILEELDTPDQAELGKKIKLINSISHSTYSMLEDLLLWTKSQSGKIEYNPSRIDLVQICKTVLDNLNILAIQKNITIKCIESKEVFLQADEEMLKIVLRNLVSNAIKFTKPGGDVKISLDQKSAELTVTISDNGVGIPTETLENLFNITHKISTSGTNNERGTGLGLLLCKEFVEKHGGQIWADSIEGKGSQFNFSLPVN
jgi:signal transduction histidine kinase